jgi:hypothetical protein
LLLNDAVPCFYCMGPTSARLGLDKKGRPYVHCVCCGARSFLPAFTPCLHGLAILGPLSLAIHDEMARDRDAWERRHRQITTYLAALRAQVSTPAVPDARPGGEPLATAAMPIAKPAA